MPAKGHKSVNKPTQRRRADHYNDPSFDYSAFWETRSYEHAAEVLAIERLLAGKHVREAVDIGGGYGRLSVLLEAYADHVVLAEPSLQQLDLAKRYLRGHGAVEKRLMQADDLQFGDGSIDLVLMVRVLNHIPKPSRELAEITRILKDDGYAIIEVANHAHFLNRLRYWRRGQRVPVKAVDLRSPEHRKPGSIPFVNHNPLTLIRQMEHAGLAVERVLSVSNLRNDRIKRRLSQRTMLRLEKFLQVPLAGLYFGPSIFFLVRKAR